MEQSTVEGPTRREMIRRTAVLAGTVAWVAPAVQTLAPAAHAVGSPGCFGCLTGGGQIVVVPGEPVPVCAGGVPADKLSFGLGQICCPTNDPTEIEIVCHPETAGRPAAESYHFDLNDLVTCSKNGDPSPPPGTSGCANRFTGTAQDDNGNTLFFDFTDNGEPGSNDKAMLKVTAPGGAVLALGSGSVSHGNLQAHEHLGKPLAVDCDCN